MTVVTISSKGRIVIPAELRRKYKLKPGSRVYIVDYGNTLALVPALENPIEQACGMLAGGSSLTQALLAERAIDKAKENRRAR